MRKVVKEVCGNTTSRQTIMGSQSISMRFHRLLLIFTKACIFIYIHRYFFYRYLFSFMQIHISFRVIHCHSDSLIFVIDSWIYFHENEWLSFFIYIHREAWHFIAYKFIFIENQVIACNFQPWCYYLLSVFQLIGDLICELRA